MPLSQVRAMSESELMLFAAYYQLLREEAQAREAADG
jgi:hypothetical protein